MKPSIRLLRLLALTSVLPLVIACPDSATPPDTLAPTLVGLTDAMDPMDVPIRATLRLRFSEPLEPTAAVSDDGLVLVEGRPTAAMLADILNPPASRREIVPCARVLEAPELLALTPRTPLRAGARYTLIATAALRDRAGNRLQPSPALLDLATRAFDVELLAPTNLAPTNLGLVVLRIAPALVPIDPAPPTFEVSLEQGESEAMSLSWSGPLADPATLAYRIPRPLTPGPARLVVRDGPHEAIFPLTVGDSPQLTPPELVRPLITAFDGAVEAKLELAAPVFARLWIGATPLSLGPMYFPVFERAPQLGALGLEEGAVVYVRVEVWGVAGPTQTFPAPSEPPLRLVAHRRVALAINEVVTHAQRDWADRTCDCRVGGCGEPFDDLPGCSARVGAESEWVELINLDAEVVDLRGGPGPWSLRIVDGTPEEIPLDPEHGALFFQAGSRVDTWLPGHVLVVKPTSPINNDARLQLVDPFGSVVSDLRLGRGGVPTGRATGQEDEAVVRDPMTGRYCKGPATPRRPNGACSAPVASPH